MPLDGTPGRLVDVAQLLPVLVIRARLGAGAGAAAGEDDLLPAADEVGQGVQRGEAAEDAVAERRGAVGDGVEREVLRVAVAVAAPDGDEDEGEEEEDDEGDDGGDEEGLCGLLVRGRSDVDS